MTGEIFNIQKFCVNDGPGIRTTVFFKGCNLCCAWCHNPESQSASKQILFYSDKCTHCGKCKEWTVNNDNDLMIWMGKGVDYITTDNPDRLKIMIETFCE